MLTISAPGLHLVRDLCSNAGQSLNQVQPGSYNHERTVLSQFFMMVFCCLSGRTRFSVALTAAGSNTDSMAVGCKTESGRERRAGSGDSPPLCITAREERRQTQPSLPSYRNAREDLSARSLTGDAL